MLCNEATTDDHHLMIGLHLEDVDLNTIWVTIWIHYSFLVVATKSQKLIFFVFFNATTPALLPSCHSQSFFELISSPQQTFDYSEEENPMRACHGPLVSMRILPNLNWRIAHLLMASKIENFDGSKMHPYFIFSKKRPRYKRMWTPTNTELMLELKCNDSNTLHFIFVEFVNPTQDAISRSQATTDANINFSSEFHGILNFLA